MDNPRTDDADQLREWLQQIAKYARLQLDGQRLGQLAEHALYLDNLQRQKSPRQAVTA